MTTKRTHTCNLCHCMVIDGTGVGLVWTAGRSFDFTTPSQAETHVCQGCITALIAANEKVLDRPQDRLDQLTEDTRPTPSDGEIYAMVSQIGMTPEEIESINAAIDANLAQSPTGHQK